MSTKSKTDTLRGVKLIIPKRLLFQEVQGETVILDLHGGQYYGLNEVGSMIWELLKKGETTDEILEALVERYDVSERRLRTDLREFLEELWAKGLLEADETGS